jgi:hypothetical protein
MDGLVSAIIMRENGELRASRLPGETEHVVHYNRCREHIALGLRQIEQGSGTRGMAPLLLAGFPMLGPRIWHSRRYR